MLFPGRSQVRAPIEGVLAAGKSVRAVGLVAPDQAVAVTNSSDPVQARQEPRVGGVELDRASPAATRPGMVPPRCWTQARHRAGVGIAHYWCPDRGLSAAARLPADAIGAGDSADVAWWGAFSRPSRVAGAWQGGGRLLDRPVKAGFYSTVPSVLAAIVSGLSSPGCRGRNPALSRLAADFTSAYVITVQARWPCDARWVRQG